MTIHDGDHNVRSIYDTNECLKKNQNKRAIILLVMMINLRLSIQNLTSTVNFSIL